MNKYQGPIYISDLDGTLLKKDAILSPYSRNTLTQLLDKGLAFTVASARSVVSIRSILQGLPLSLPVVEFNGALISDLETGHHRVINNIDASISEAIYKYFVQANHSPFISTYNGIEDCVYYSSILNEGMEWYINYSQRKKDPRLRKTQNLAYALDDKVVAITAIGNSDAITRLSTGIQEQFGEFINIHVRENYYFPGWYWLMILDRKATKDQAIRALLEECNMDDRELVVFGDHQSDIPMFKIAHRCVAVENAIDEVKSLATTIADSHQHDGVVKFLESEWKKNQ